jgi:hypothetical protein
MARGHIVALESQADIIHVGVLEFAPSAECLSPGRADVVSDAANAAILETDYVEYRCLTVLGQKRARLHSSIGRGVVTPLKQESSEFEQGDYIG